MKKYSYLFLAAFLVASSVPVYPGNSSKSSWSLEGITSAIVSCVSVCQSKVAFAFSSFSTEAKVAIGGLATLLTAYMGYKWACNYGTRSSAKEIDPICNDDRPDSTTSKRPNTTVVSSITDLQKYFLTNKAVIRAAELAVSEKARIAQEKAKQEELEDRRIVEEIKRTQEEERRRTAVDATRKALDDELLWLLDETKAPKDDSSLLDDGIVNSSEQEVVEDAISEEEKENVSKRDECRAKEAALREAGKKEERPFGYKSPKRPETQETFEIPMMEACAQGDLNKLRTLCSKDLFRKEFCKKSKDGSTMIMVATRYGQKAVICFFYDTINCQLFRHQLLEQDNSGDTALIIASRKGYKKMAKLYLGVQDTGCAVNNKGESALMVAVQKGDLGMGKVLLESSKELSRWHGVMVDWKGDTAFSFAIQQGHIKFARSLLQTGSNWSEEHLKNLEKVLFNIAMKGGSNDALDALRRELDDKISGFKRQSTLETDQPIDVIVGCLKILGLEPTERRLDEIGRAYRTLSRKYHPDKQAKKPQQEKSANESKFKEIGHAYGQLTKLLHG